MEAFDGQAFRHNASHGDNNATNLYDTIASNPGDHDPADRGIVATNSNNGSEVGRAAYIYRLSSLWDEYFNYITSHALEGVNIFVDQHSWAWQQLTELGWVGGYNATANANMELVMEVANTSAVRDYITSNLFSVYSASAFPDEPDVAKALKYGGWEMTPSNVMFTNGETDTWRAFSVMSAEQEDGAPDRLVTQSVTERNKAPGSGRVLGILYDGAGHTEDMVLLPQNASDQDQDPLYQRGADLFARAYNTWLPCFNESRDAVRNDRDPDGSAKGDENAATSIIRQHVGSWMMSVLSVVYLCTIW